MTGHTGWSMSFLDAVLLLFICVPIAASRKNVGNVIFDRESTATLRGIAMLGIILHHVHNVLGYHSIVITSVGYLATGLFFFISGFGNTLSMRRKPHLPITWFVEKFKKIYIPFFVVYWVYFCSIVFQYHNQAPQFSDVVFHLVTVTLPNQVSWFPKIILLCFFLHGIVKLLFKQESIQILVMSAALCVYAALMWKLKVGDFWYDSVLCYPLGAVVATQEQRIAKLINSYRKKSIALVCALLFFILFFAASQFHISLRIPCAFAFSVSCFIYTMLFVCKTCFISWIGNNSFEFYLIHIACLQIFSNVIPLSPILYTACVFCGTIVGVYLYLTVKKGLLKVGNAVSLHEKLNA